MDGQNEKAKFKSILIIEDEKAIQEVLKDAIELEGYNVSTADNGQEGLNILPRMPTPCLILLDLMMPVMNGWQFAEAISKDMVLATIPIVIVTAYGDRAGLIPSKGVLKKPVDLDTLLNVVKKWCNGGSCPTG